MNDDIQDDEVQFSSVQGPTAPSQPTQPRWSSLSELSEYLDRYADKSHGLAQDTDLLHEVAGFLRGHERR